MDNYEDRFDCLKLENQICFPLYACSKEIVRRYKPYLDELDLTYTQYIAMMVLWEKGKCSAKELGEKLYLDSGTLTPVLKSLEKKGFVKRLRSADDERQLLVEITSEGEELKERAAEIPAKVASCVNLAPEEVQNLYKTLYKILGSL